MCLFKAKESPFFFLETQSVPRKFDFFSRETDFIPIRRLQLDVHRIEWSLYLPRLPRFEY